MTDIEALINSDLAVDVMITFLPSEIPQFINVSMSYDMLVTI